MPKPKFCVFLIVLWAVSPRIALANSVVLDDATVEFTGVWWTTVIFDQIPILDELDDVAASDHCRHQLETRCRFSAYYDRCEVSPIENYSLRDYKFEKIGFLDDIINSNSSSLSTRNSMRPALKIPGGPRVPTWPAFVPKPWRYRCQATCVAECPLQCQFATLSECEAACCGGNICTAGVTENCGECFAEGDCFSCGLNNCMSRGDDPPDPPEDPDPGNPNREPPDAPGGRGPRCVAGRPCFHSCPNGPPVVGTETGVARSDGSCECAGACFEQPGGAGSECEVSRFDECPETCAFCYINDY